MARILIVEDDEAMQEALVESLEDEDFEAVGAGTGKEAVRIAEGDQFDLVVSDIRLPGLSGIETIRALKQNHPGLKCIVITGYASADTPVQAIRLKVDDYLFKPFGLEYFLECVQRVLSQDTVHQENLSMFGKLASWLSGSKDVWLEETLAERVDAFRGLYLGTRSGYLTEAGALQIFNSLDGLEAEFRSLLNERPDDKAVAKALQAKYSEVSAQLGELEGGSLPAAQDFSVSAAEFKPLYQALRGSQVSPEDLLYAPLLRTTDDSRFETLPRLLELKRRLWP